MASRGHISLILKGPKKSAQRAGARRGVHLSSCTTHGRDVQCYAPCSPGVDARVDRWFVDDHKPLRRGRPAKPGTLLYTGPFCGSAQNSSTLSGARRRRKRRR